MEFIDLYYFSGTGNTILVAEKLIEIFKKNNIKVNALKIENSKPEEVDTKKTIGFAFPVVMQSTFPFIWDFFRKLPKTNSTEIFMVDTLHAFSGAIVGPLKKVLIKKGYKPIGAKEIIMPNNFKNKIEQEEDKKKINKGLKEAEKYAYSLINKNAEWKNVPILPHVFYFLVSRKWFWKIFKKYGSKFKVDNEKCTKCKICIEICPLDNIVMADFPGHKNKCEMCMRCVMFCPSEAIKVPLVKTQKYNAVKINKIKNSILN